jgi:CHAT domain-containing protein
VLTWFPATTGLLAFAADAHQTRVVRLPDARPEGLLAPFEAELAAAKRVRALPYGPVRGLDVHALPFRGAPLIAHAAVVYGLDLPPVNKSSVNRRALLVADPRGDLRGARAEADAVEAHLKGWTLTRLDGEAATGAAVRAALAATDLFHYAGHGRFAGAMGWDSALPLAADARLGVDDILALPNVPAQVVLSGCETARQAADAPLEAVGLAQAFMVAGAESAIAATRPVDDTLARDLAADLYLHAGTESAEDALRRAQTVLAQGPPGRDWAAFRVLVR